MIPVPGGYPDRTFAVRYTEPEKPFRLLTVTVDANEEPGGIFNESGLVDMVKSGVGSGGPMFSYRLTSSIHAVSE